MPDYQQPRREGASCLKLTLIGLKGEPLINRHRGIFRRRGVDGHGVAVVELDGKHSTV